MSVFVFSPLNYKKKKKCVECMLHVYALGSQKVALDLLELEFQVIVD